MYILNIYLHVNFKNISFLIILMHLILKLLNYFAKCCFSFPFSFFFSIFTLFFPFFSQFSPVCEFFGGPRGEFYPSTPPWARACILYRKNIAKYGQHCKILNFLIIHILLIFFVWQYWGTQKHYRKF